MVSAVLEEMFVDGLGDQVMLVGIGSQQAQDVGLDLEDARGAAEDGLPPPASRTAASTNLCRIAVGVLS
jgi:hypothetical protein